MRRAAKDTRKVRATHRGRTAQGGSASRKAGATENRVERRAWSARSIIGSRENRLWLALSVSLLVHAVALSLQFKLPEQSRTSLDKTLDIVLVNSKSVRKPEKAQVLAQNNLDGGGNTDQDRRAKTPLPPSREQQKGEEPEKAEKRVQAVQPKPPAREELEKAEKRVQDLEARQRKLLTQSRSKLAAAPPSEIEAPVEPSLTPTLSGIDLANRAREMARIEGQIAKQTDDYNKRPRKKFIGLRAVGTVDALYVDAWRTKVERIGTLNYPQAAKGKIYGSLILTVTINSDGSVDSIEINRSSGHKILDEAARRVVDMAGPFAPFPPEIRRSFDQYVITRAWNFVPGNQLETESSR